MKCNKIACFFSGPLTLGLTLLRIPIGIIFMAHGAQKLFGWYGGGGLEATAQSMAALDIGPGLLLAIVVGSAEFFGGLLLVIGLLSRLAALSLTVDMAVAILVVHLPHGLFSAQGGYEFALALLAASVAVLIAGPGRFALDGLIHHCCLNKKST